MEKKKENNVRKYIIHSLLVSIKPPHLPSSINNEE